MSKANTAGNAVLYYEAGQSLVGMAAMTNSGDAQNFTSPDLQWSERSGYEAKVRPNGLITGGSVSPNVGTNNSVNVAALTCYLAGVLTAVTGAAATVTRPAASNKKINSITITSAGAIAVVAGTDNTAFSTVRGAVGGPPLIPVGSIEVAQVKLASNTAADVATAEIFQVPGTHTERYDYPTWSEQPESGAIKFLAALSLIHTGSVPKGVYTEYYTPEFSEIPNAADFVPPGNTHSVSSTQVYGGTVGASTSTLGQGSFKAMLKDGVTDSFLNMSDEILWFKFYPDRNKVPYMLCQGKLGVASTFPAGAAISAACTISASTAAARKSE